MTTQYLIRDIPGCYATDTYSLFQDGAMVGHIDNTERGACKLFMYNGFCEDLVATYTSLDECKTAIVKKLTEETK